jgi:glyoxylase-like metal-dependent hydrolase (beta-lactamase superfamily II)/3-mercaptopyruvate sulfurtransferase SseA
MYFKRFYLTCLAQASYLIGSGGEAAIVDPRRDVDEYLAEAAANGLTIKYVIETHLHADFVSGHRELAERTGAEIVFGARANAELPHRAVHEADELPIGNVTIRILETPGHTPEGISLLITDHDHPEEAPKLLTGDTLFIGDVGRPDLAGGKGFTAPQMAGMLYDTLHEKILKLDDAVEVYPAHGAGSMCGRNISTELSSTIGEQRQSNYALQSMPRDEFVALMTAELPPMPAYFPADAELNRRGAVALGQLSAPTAMAPVDFASLAASDVFLLDVRSAAQFGAGHIPGSVNIGLGGQFASWAGSLIKLGQPILLVVAGGAQVDEAVMRLARVGHETVRGYLFGGFEAWRDAGLPIVAIPQISVDDLDQLRQEQPGLQILDVRRPAEYRGGHVPEAVSSPLGPAVVTGAADFDPALPTAVICAGGYRSSAAASFLEQAGFQHLLNVTGGTNAWSQAGYPIAEGSGRT